MIKRSSGILVHPSSFPSSFGIGDFGKSGYEFIDFLYKSKQKIWQILPLGPIGFSNSPYQCLSAFAGNELLISIEDLVEDGYLNKATVEDYKLESTEVVDYSKVKEIKNILFRIAFKNFEKAQDKKMKISFNIFCEENNEWLDDYSLFISLKEYYDNRIWTSWPEGIKNRNKTELERMKVKLVDKILYNKFLQYLFFKQWNLLKNYANNKGIKIIGDVPIYMPLDCVDVWVNPELYLLDDYGNPTFVAGGPPDSFSKIGQRWDNCLYNWNVHKENGFSWWIKRISFTIKLVDIVRIDHFRGFDEYWAIPYSESNPANGKWVEGPGKELFDEIIKAVGNFPIIVEDIGLITKSVIELRDNYNFTGIKILQCAFDGDRKNNNLPHNFIDSKCVVYTGTHDSNTLLGWYNALEHEDKEKCLSYLVNSKDITWSLIRMAFSSVAVIAILQIQDILNLDSKHRMNVPGTEEGNWEFRYLPNTLNSEYIEKLREVTMLYNR